MGESHLKRQIRSLYLLSVDESGVADEENGVALSSMLRRHAGARGWRTHMCVAKS